MCKDNTNNTYLWYINNIETKITENVEEFWRYIKSKSRNCNLTPSVMYFGDVGSNLDEQDIANLFLEYSVSVQGWT